MIKSFTHKGLKTFFETGSKEGIILDRLDASIAPGDMALRIYEATHTSPESWLRMQTKLDLWYALRKKPENVSEFHHQQAV